MNFMSQWLEALLGVIIAKALSTKVETGAQEGKDSNKEILNPVLCPGSFQPLIPVLKPVSWLLESTQLIQKEGK